MLSKARSNNMTATWQALIPETPSTEPISAILDTDSSAVVTSDARDSVGGPGGRRGLVENTYNMANMRNHLQSNSRRQTIVSSSRAASPKRHEEMESEYSDLPYGEQIWRFYSKKLHRRKLFENRRRLLLKDGLCNLCQISVDEKVRRYWSDVFTTLVDARWRWTLFVFSVSYLISWTVFAILWWIVLVAHNDITNFEKPGWVPCVEGAGSFASVFLFSIETQHTIGYGHHRMTSECADAILVLCIQSICGVLIEAFMVGVVFAKLSRPKKRAQTLIFSKNAVISQRDGQLFLMFRVGDIRKSHILEAHVRAQIIRKRVTAEGEVLPIHQEEIKVGGFGEDEDRILLFWPTTVVHPIDSESPLYEMSASDLLNSKIEIMVILEGVVESTGMTTQARTSYLPSEILWGHRFYDTTCYKSDIGRHVVNFDLFHSTFPVETPLCSAQDLDNIRELKSQGLTEFTEYVRERADWRANAEIARLNRLYSVASSGREILSSMMKGSNENVTAEALLAPPSSTGSNHNLTARNSFEKTLNSLASLDTSNNNANNNKNIKLQQKRMSELLQRSSGSQTLVVNKPLVNRLQTRNSSPALRVPQINFLGHMSDSDKDEDEESYGEHDVNLNGPANILSSQTGAVQQANSNSTNNMTSDSNV